MNETVVSQPRLFVAREDDGASKVIGELLAAAGHSAVFALPTDSFLNEMRYPDSAVVLLTVNRRNRHNVEWVTQLTRRDLAISCLILYEDEDFEIALECLDLGAAGHLRKSDISAGIVSSVKLCCRDAQTKAQRIRNVDLLLESREAYRSLIENAPIALTIKDLDSRFLITNGRFEELYEATHGNSLGKTPFDVFRPEEAEAHAALDREVMDKETVILRDLEIARPDGTVRNALITKYPIFDSYRTIVGIGTIGIDKTELVKAERLFRRFFNLPLVGAAISTPSSRWLQVNDSFCKMLGYTREEMLAQSWEPLTHPDDLQENLNAYKAAAAGAQDTHSYEKRFIHKNGDIVHTKVYWEFVRNPDGTPAHLLALVADITERIVADTALREAEAQLHQAQKMEALGQLTGGVAHDFNNILAVVMGNLELISELFSNEDAKEMISAMLRSTERGARLTQQLLSFGRQSTLTPEVFDVNESVDVMVKLFNSVLPDFVSVKHVCLGEAVFAEIDRKLFENALLNLALNARDAMPDGGELTIETSKRYLQSTELSLDEDVTAGMYIVIAILDTGCGIEAENLGRAIEPFFTTKSVDKGSGLGLSMVYGFAKQSGGSMSIESTVGVGTTVCLFFPIASEREAKAPAHEVLPQQRGSKKFKILVVEDDIEVRTVVVRQLIQFGYLVAEAEDGATAEACLTSDRSFDLILTDLVMPGQSQGSDVARFARTNRPDVRVVCMSGNLEQIRTGEDRLFDAVLLKPISSAELARSIQSVLGAGDASPDTSTQA